MNTPGGAVFFVHTWGVRRGGQTEKVLQKVGDSLQRNTKGRLVVTVVVN